MLTKDIIEHLCRKHGAKHSDITPYVRQWITRSGNTYIISPRDQLFAIFHRNPDGSKWNFYRDAKRPRMEILSEATRFIDMMEGHHA